MRLNCGSRSFQARYINVRLTSQARCPSAAGLVNENVTGVDFGSSSAPKPKLDMGAGVVAELGLFDRLRDARISAEGRKQQTLAYPLPSRRCNHQFALQ
jgi:hypothetical protein